MTYLVIHNLLSRIPWEPCQPKLTNIALHFYIQWASYFVYFCGKTKHCNLTAAAQAQGDSIMEDTQGGRPLCVKIAWSSTLPSYLLRALCCARDSICSSCWFLLYQLTTIQSFIGMPIINLIKTITWLRLFFPSVVSMLCQVNDKWLCHCQMTVSFL